MDDYTRCISTFVECWLALECRRFWFGRLFLLLFFVLFVVAVLVVVAVVALFIPIYFPFSTNKTLCPVNV